MAFLFLTLFIASQADDLSRLSAVLEDLVYDNIHRDLYNEKSCKAPSQQDYVFIWTNKPDLCLRPDEDEFVFATYDAYLEGRRLEISQEFRRVWQAYKKHAWGFDSLYPVTGEGNDDRGGLNFFIYDNLDALYLMGSEEEFEEAVKFLKENSIMRDQNLRTGPLISNVLGGLLSAYELSGKQELLNMTTELSEALLSAFAHKEEQLPNTLFNLETKAGSCPTYKLQTAEVTQWSEFLRLYQITGDERYLQTVERLISYIYDFHPRSFALPPYISTMDLKRRRSRFSGPLTLDPHSFPIYRNLFNAWQQTGRNNTKLSEVYELSKSFFLSNLTFQTKDGNPFIGERAENETVLHRMHIGSCAFAGQLALDNFYSYNHSEVQLANKLIETCVQMHRTTKTELPPTYTYYTPKGPYFEDDHMAYKLFPDLFEALLHMYRLTHDTVYRTIGLYYYKVLRRACATENGYSGVLNVNKVPPEHDNQMPSYFTTKALKYLFLLFSSVRVR